MIYDNRLNLFTPGSWMVDKIKKPKEEYYQLPIRSMINQQEIDNFKQDFADIESFTHKKYSDIANGAKFATTSLEDYFAETIKLNQEATVEGYNSFIDEKKSGNLQNKDSRHKIFEKSAQLATSANNAKEEFEGVNTQLQESESRLQAMISTHTPYGVRRHAFAQFPEHIRFQLTHPIRGATLHVVKIESPPPYEADKNQILYI